MNCIQGEAQNTAWGGGGGGLCGLRSQWCLPCLPFTALPGSLEACPLASKPLKGSACPKLEFPLWRKHRGSDGPSLFLQTWGRIPISADGGAGEEWGGGVKMVKNSCGSCQQTRAIRDLLRLPSGEASRTGT